MKRYDKAGRDVTDLAGLWSEDDCEIVATNYQHPEITTGQHTNGPATIWVRCLLGNGRTWICTPFKSMHKVVECWKQFGVDGFLPF